MVDTGGLMSDALKLSAEQVPAAVKAISAAGLPAAIERQAAAGERLGLPHALGAACMLSLPCSTASCPHSRCLLAPVTDVGMWLPVSSEVGTPASHSRYAPGAGVAEAQVLILVVDGQSGLTAADEEVVSWLRRSHPKKPVILAVNKCENSAKADIQTAEFWGLGLHPIPLSAISGTGTGELMERLMAQLPPPRSVEVRRWAGAG